MRQGARQPFGVHLSLGDAVDEMVLMWFTSAAMEEEAKVQLGLADDELRTEVTATSAVMEDKVSYVHKAMLKSLAPRTTYYYRCGSSKDGWSRVHTFSREGAEMPDTETVTFLTYGDMGVHFKNSHATLLAVQKEEPLDSIDFVFHAGDLAYAFKNMSRWRVFLDRIEPIASKVPYLVCTGNRDDIDDVHKRFSMPLSNGEGSRNLYYSFQYTYVYGIVLAVGGQVPFDLKSQQFSWLLKELEKASALRNDVNSQVSWIVVWVHTPLYSSSDGHAGGNKELRDLTEKLFVDFKVTLILAGDDHVYERSFPRFQTQVEIPGPDSVDGSDTLIVDSKYPVSFTVGTGGIDLDGWKSKDRPIWSAHRELAHGYLKVVANAEKLTTTFVRASDGKVLDKMHLATTTPKRARARRGGWVPQLLVMAGIVAAVYVFVVYKRNNSRPASPFLAKY